CDGQVNDLDPPNIIFVAGNGEGTYCSEDTAAVSRCHTGVLRVLDGASGKEVWSLRKAEDESIGFMGLSIAVADLDRDGKLEIAAITGEGYLVIINHRGELKMKSDVVVPGSNAYGFGWGGSLAIGDMNNDGAPEITYGRTVFTTLGGELKWVFDGEGSNSALSLLADVDEDGQLELIAGRAAYKYDGTRLWQTEGLPNNLLPGVGDFDRDGKPEVVLVGRYPKQDDVEDRGKVWVVSGETGELVAGPLVLPDLPPKAGAGGPPTVADFDGDGKPEIGIANANYYSVTKVNLSLPNVGNRLSTLWKQINHDLSSSVTGSTVFDFEGDGKAEVVYNDECYLWVYDGTTGAVRFATQTTSFTANEASLVADVDGDGRAEMVMIANRASPTRWHCNEEPWTSDDPSIGRPAWVPPTNGETAYSGITVWGGRAGSWVGTRKLWNQHSYHVTNICDSRDSACSAADNVYGAIPRHEQRNWELPWLNNLRQNVQDKGIFDAPDPTLTLSMTCPYTLIATLRNVGLALLPAGVEVGFYRIRAGQETLLGTATSTTALFPGQGVELSYAGPADDITAADIFVVRILVDAANPTFNECRPENNSSEPMKNRCTLG
ncbi:MAG: VCBS repeat-containing protein, partial [Deltaproteobacteria bacterium]|nr:VCBS repeat-containing protein [Deltaproteobacteria bacterium]